jgi:hypothetical protein
MLARCDLIPTHASRGSVLKLSLFVACVNPMSDGVLLSACADVPHSDDRRTRSREPVLSLHRVGFSELLRAVVAIRKYVRPAVQGTGFRCSEGTIHNVSEESRSAAEIPSRGAAVRHEKVLASFRSALRKLRAHWLFPRLRSIMARARDSGCLRQEPRNTRNTRKWSNNHDDRLLRRSLPDHGALLRGSL